MAEFDHEDVVEEILILLDVKDLIRCKSVCKSWRSLITSPRFVNRHLDHSYNKDRDNNELEHRRIILVDELSSCYNDDYYYDDHCLVGSSNGLVCIISDCKYELLVINPLTREMRRLALPDWISSSVCWGFGYDSSSNDYKVIVGTREGENQTCVHVLSLKSNVWRDIGEVKYRWFVTKDGVLCNGALHWIISADENNKKLIVSYDLSTEEFKEIPQPDYDARYRCTSSSELGIVKGCLCVYESSSIDVWLVKKYNVKQSGELVPHDRKMGYDIVHHLRPPMLNETRGYIDIHWDDIGAPIFVQSLVSPHINHASNLTKI